MQYLQLLRCPECSADLTAEAKKVSCTGCKSDYPLIDGVPWLFTPAGETLAAWRLRFNALLSTLQEEEEELKAALKKQLKSELTIKRLRKLLQAKVEQKKLLTDLMNPLLKEQSGKPELYKGMQLRDIAGQSISGYYANIHRDWAWDTDENRICLDIVGEMVAKTGAKRLLILGAGAGRLAFDLHDRLSPEVTLALDINPLMVLAARKVTKGRNLKLYEFPLAPRDLDSHAVLQTCRAPKEAPDNLNFLLADGLAPPVKKGAFELILTPWFIDIVPATLEHTASVVNQLLCDGGYWVNFGSLAFNHRDPTENLSSEETLATVEVSGFKPEHSERKKIPYMQSPHSAHGRIEEVFSFVAKKTRDIPQQNASRKGESWLTNFAIPVPADRVFANTGLVYSIYLDVMEQIDGKKSINDIASVFGPKHGLPPEEAAVSVKNFLTRVMDSAARGSTY